MKYYLLIICIFILQSFKAQLNDAAVHKDSSIIVAWATDVEITRGPQQIGVDSLGLASAGLPEFALGKAGDNPIVSLGDGGTAVLTFEYSIKDGPGADFAVFENSFDGKFLELAFVEVSSDGLNFFRFPSVSHSDTINGVGSFEFIETENIYDLAGKYPLFYGTPFDLTEMQNLAGLNIQNITHIKIIDVIGSVLPEYCSRDSEGNKVADPWPTPFPSSGFDLDAVGIIHNNDPASINSASNHASVFMFPHPASSLVNLRLNESGNSSVEIHLFTVSGALIKKWNYAGDFFTLDISDISSGIYFLELNCSGKLIHQKLVIRK